MQCIVSFFFVLLLFSVLIIAVLGKTDVNSCHCHFMHVDVAFCFCFLKCIFLLALFFFVLFAFMLNLLFFFKLYLFFQFFCFVVYASSWRATEVLRFSF